MDGRALKASHRCRRESARARAVLLLLLACGSMCVAAAPARASVAGSGVASSGVASSSRTLGAQPPGSSLESAAAKASSTGRAVAMSLIGLALAVAAIVLAFRRDFKEAAGVFVVGIVAILFATSAGVSLLRDTVTSLFGSG
jgi:hypothetical protein